MTAQRVAPLFRGWSMLNERLVEALRDRTPAQLALTSGDPPAAVWQTASHLAGTRVFWLCSICGEPGQERTPFRDLDLAQGGWEDDPSHPRRADELVDALASTWSIVQHVLDTWTFDSLSREARRVRADGQVQFHTRQSLLYRMLTHDAYHTSEMSLVFGSHGLGEIDIWRGLARVE